MGFAKDLLIGQKAENEFKKILDKKKIGFEFNEGKTLKEKQRYDGVDTKWGYSY